MNKPVRVIFLDEADLEYKRLNEIVGKQIEEEKAEGNISEPSSREGGYIDIAIFERVYHGFKRAIDYFCRR